MMTFSPYLPALLLLSLLHQTTHTSALILYNDGSTHTITESISDSVSIRSATSLLFSNDNSSIHAPKGSESAVRLYMSSSLNMTSGEIIGGEMDASSNGEVDDDTIVGAGVIVGSASHATFYEGATVRGGSYASQWISSNGQVVHEDMISYRSGKGGDAIIGLYFSSTVTIYGGNFRGGRGSSSYGHSLHVAYEASANIHGGSFRGSFLARDRGVIIVHGCVSRVGNKLVGHLDNGDSIDVELVEVNGGQVVVQTPNFAQTCEKYRRRSSGDKVGLSTGVIITFTIFLAVGGLVFGYV